MNTLIIEHSGIIEKGGKMSEISKEKNCEKSSPKKKLGKMFTKNENCHNFFIYGFFQNCFLHILVQAQGYHMPFSELKNIKN